MLDIAHHLSRSRPAFPCSSIPNILSSFRLVLWKFLWSNNEGSTSCSHYSLFFLESLPNGVWVGVFHKRPARPLPVASVPFKWALCRKLQLYSIGRQNLLKDETDPSKVLPTFQFTMQVEEPATAEYWLVMPRGENCWLISVPGTLSSSRADWTQCVIGQVRMWKSRSIMISGWQMASPIQMRTAYSQRSFHSTNR